MFLVSKLLSAVTQPMFWFALWWAIALLMLKRWRKPAVVMLWTGLVALWAAAGFDDTLLRWKMKLEVANGHEKEVQPRVQA